MKVLSYISLLFILIISGASIFAQDQNGAPQGFNYQAIARDYNGQEMRNMDIMVRVSIYPGETGPFEWKELHSVTTNKFGLFTIIIGQGTRVEGSIDHFSDIKWGSGARFFEVELDFPNDASGFLPTGKNQLFSVPYALYSNYAANGGSGGILDNDTDPTNERQNLSQTDTLLQLINNDGSIQSSVKNDFDPKNELQDLLINENILKITNNPDANDINLSPYFDNTDRQMLSNKGDSIGIAGGNTIDLSRFKDNTDKQQLILETDSIRITNGNAVNISELRNPASVLIFVEKKTATTPLQNPDVLRFSDTKVEGINYNTSSGIFTVIHEGLYSFYLVYEAYIGQTVSLVVQSDNIDDWPSSNVYNEKLRIPFMYYLKESDTFYIRITNTGSSLGIANFYGFKVY